MTVGMVWYGMVGLPIKKEMEILIEGVDTDMGMRLAVRGIVLVYAH
jgi:hypothetical protein